MPRDDDFFAPEPAPEPAAPTSEQIGDAARAAIMDALAILEHNNVPLAKLLAQQAVKRPDLLLKAMGRFSPTQAKDQLLPTIQALHLAALRAMAAQPLIDVTPAPVATDDWLA